MSVAKIDQPHTILRVWLSLTILLLKFAINATLENDGGGLALVRHRAQKAGGQHDERQQTVNEF